MSWIRAQPYVQAPEDALLGRSGTRATMLRGSGMIELSDAIDPGRQTTWQTSILST